MGFLLIFGWRGCWGFAGCGGSCGGLERSIWEVVGAGDGVLGGLDLGVRRRGITLGGAALGGG